MSETMNHYQVLGIDDTSATTNQIRKKYIKLITKYHPDKNDKFDHNIFEAIQKAWECLGNEERRKEYDNDLKEKKSQNHHDLKNAFEEYIRLAKINEDIDESKKNIKIEVLTEIQISSQELNEKLNNRILEREQQEIELSSSCIFPEGEKIDNYAFNALFLSQKVQVEQKNKNQISNLG